MFQTRYFLNPKRHKELKSLSVLGKIRNILQQPFIKLGLWLGFQHIDYSYVHGNKSRLTIGSGCSTMNTLFNVISGDITIGSDTLFAHNCMVLTGTHNFIDGLRGDLHETPLKETPSSGNDIVIGKGCFFGSGSIVLGGVTIGDNVTIASGAVVVYDLPSDIMVAGIPAKPLKRGE